MAMGVANGWIPPENPDPSEILHSALDDTKNRQYETALAKFVWFHENALRLDDAQYGVRLSFALSYWMDLASVYPPARSAFVRTRDETEEAFRKDVGEFRLFHDLAALNARLGEGLRTADVFEMVARSDPSLAHHLYHVAERYLIAVGRYRVCRPFLNPEERLARAAEFYRFEKEHEEQMATTADFPVPKHAKSSYVTEVSTLVALLVLNDRPEDARRASTESLRVIDDEDFRATLDAALTGHFPERPWC